MVSVSPSTESELFTTLTTEACWYFLNERFLVVEKGLFPKMNPPPPQKKIHWLFRNFSPVSETATGYWNTIPEIQSKGIFFRQNLSFSDWKVLITISIGVLISLYLKKWFHKWGKDSFWIQHKRKISWHLKLFKIEISPISYFHSERRCKQVSQPREGNYHDIAGKFGAQWLMCTTEKSRSPSCLRTSNGTTNWGRNRWMPAEHNEAIHSHGEILI